MPERNFKPIYLDNAATTRPSERVLQVMRTAAGELWGNPSSPYRPGRAASSGLEKARTEIAGVFGCGAGEMYFTSSGTESNNLAIFGAARARKNFADEAVVTGYEHPSVLETVSALRREGFTVRVANPGRDGSVDPEDVLALVGGKTAVVAAMSVNNETGAVIDIASLAAGVKEINPRTAFHCDHVQGFLKTGLPIANTAVDTASISAHKIHGPRGIGGLYVKKGMHIETVIHGGGQERGLRSGTESPALALAFADAAVSYDAGAAAKTVTALGARLRSWLASEGMEIHSPADASPFILCFSVRGLPSEVVLNFMDANGVYIGAGSACSKGKKSHVLMSMGLAADSVASALRVSFSIGSTDAELERLTELLAEAKKVLIGVGGGKR